MIIRHISIYLMNKVPCLSFVWVILVICLHKRLHCSLIDFNYTSKIHFCRYGEPFLWWQIGDDWTNSCKCSNLTPNQHQGRIKNQHDKTLHSWEYWEPWIKWIHYRSYFKNCCSFFLIESYLSDCTIVQ